MSKSMKNSEQFWDILSMESRDTKPQNNPRSQIVQSALQELNEAWTKQFFGRVQKETLGVTHSLWKRDAFQTFKFQMLELSCHKHGLFNLLLRIPSQGDVAKVDPLYPLNPHVHQLHHPRPNMSNPKPLPGNLRLKGDLHGPPLKKPEQHLTTLQNIKNITQIQSIPVIFIILYIRYTFNKYKSAIFKSNHIKSFHSTFFIFSFKLIHIPNSSNPSLLHTLSLKSHQRHFFRSARALHLGQHSRDVTATSSPEAAHAWCRKRRTPCSGMAW